MGFYWDLWGSMGFWVSLCDPMVSLFVCVGSLCDPYVPLCVPMCPYGVLMYPYGVSMGLHVSLWGFHRVLMCTYGVSMSPHVSLWGPCRILMCPYVSL